MPTEDDKKQDVMLAKSRKELEDIIWKMKRQGLTNNRIQAIVNSIFIEFRT